MSPITEHHLLHGITQCYLPLDTRERAPNFFSHSKVNSAFRLLRVGKLSISLLAGVETGHVHLCPVAGNTEIPYGK